ncbi:hypothetical protein BZA77DRAFT_297027 [Pyronema omphalodes]|nr:hypothetical protein BZA77DRAFT_297027 [Pyronema omphalodes]
MTDNKGKAYETPKKPGKMAALFSPLKNSPLKNSPFKNSPSSSQSPSKHPRKHINISQISAPIPQTKPGGSTVVISHEDAEKLPMYAIPSGAITVISLEAAQEKLAGVVPEILDETCTSRGSGIKRNSGSAFGSKPVSLKGSFQVSDFGAGSSDRGSQGSEAGLLGSGFMKEAGDGLGKSLDGIMESMTTMGTPDSLLTFGEFLSQDSAPLMTGPGPLNGPGPMVRTSHSSRQGPGLARTSQGSMGAPMITGSGIGILDLSGLELIPLDQAQDRFGSMRGKRGASHNSGGDTSIDTTDTLGSIPFEQLRISSPEERRSLMPNVEATDFSKFISLDEAQKRYGSSQHRGSDISGGRISGGSVNAGSEPVTPTRSIGLIPKLFGSANSRSSGAETADNVHTPRKAELISLEEAQEKFGSKTRRSN